MDDLLTLIIFVTAFMGSLIVGYAIVAIYEGIKRCRWGRK